MLQIGEKFLDKSGHDAKRIALQTRWLELYYSTHIHNKIVSANGDTIDIDPLVPLPNTISEIFSDLLFLNFPKISFGTASNDDQLKPITNKLAVDTLEAAGLNSATGMLFCNMFNIDSKTHWKFMSPTQAIWENDKLDNLETILFFKLKEVDKKGNMLYHIQEHKLIETGRKTLDGGKTTQPIIAGIIETYEMWVNVNYKITNIFNDVTTSTGLDFIPVITVWNVGQLNSKIGRSDYQGKEQLFAELDNRYDQINYVLQEHSEPWTFLPPGILTKNGQFQRRNGKMVEKAGGGVGDNTVDIVSWDASLDSAFRMIDSILDITLFTSRISGAIASRGNDSRGGGVESGKAVIWKSVQTWTAVQKRQGYWSTFFKVFFTYLGKMDKTYAFLTEDVIKQFEIQWATNLPMDETADTDNLTKQVAGGIKSQLTAIGQLQDKDQDAAIKEQQQIQSEQETEASIQASSSTPVTL